MAPKRQNRRRVREIKDNIHLFSFRTRTSIKIPRRVLSGNRNGIQSSRQRSSLPTAGEGEASLRIVDIEQGQEMENSQYFVRKEKLLEKWDEIRDQLVTTQIETHSMPVDQICIVCSGNPSEIRCNDCGTEQFFCSSCAVELHQGRNLFHTMEYWKGTTFVPFLHIPKLQLPRNVKHLPCCYENWRRISILTRTGNEKECDICFCDCISDARILLTHGLWPASPTTPVLAIEVLLMDFLESLFWSHRCLLAASAMLSNGKISCHKSRSWNGRLDDITLGFKNIEDYEENRPYFGSTIGRVANRIAKGKFSIDGEDFNIDCNEKGINHLHGGLVGFDKHFWSATEDENKQSVCFNLESPAGDQGYPGEVDITVCYALNADNELKITYKAVAKDKPTIINLTCHPYFNLSGIEKKCDKVDDHLLEITANCYLPLGENQIPTGERRCVNEDDGIFDFRKPKLIGKDIEKLPGNGYDHSFCKFPKENFCLRASHPESGRVLEVYSSQPAIHIYTPNYTCDSLLGKHGDFYKGRCGFAIENQNFPNAINLHFPPCPILRPGELYEQFTTMKFSVQ